jgi:hypothetical protein
MDEKSLQETPLLKPTLKKIRFRCYLVFLIIIIISKLGKTVQQTQLRAEKQRNKLL